MDDDLLRDLFRAFGPITVRRMFGGKAILADGAMIALVAFDTLFIKADEHTEARFRAAGSHPFAYRRQTRSVTVPSFWTLPEEALEDADMLAAWARLGHEAALRSPARRRGKATGKAGQQRAARSSRAKPRAAEA